MIDKGNIGESQKHMKAIKKQTWRKLLQQVFANSFDVKSIWKEESYTCSNSYVHPDYIFLAAKRNYITSFNQPCEVYLEIKYIWIAICLGTWTRNTLSSSVIWRINLYVFSHNPCSFWSLLWVAGQADTTRAENTNMTWNSVTYQAKPCMHRSHFA